VKEANLKMHMEYCRCSFYCQD